MNWERILGKELLTLNFKTAKLRGTMRNIFRIGILALMVTGLSACSIFGDCGCPGVKHEGADRSAVIHEDVKIKPVFQPNDN